MGEIAGKTIGFLLVVGALVAGGVLVLIGAHAYNDYLNSILGWGLIGLAVVTAGVGAFIVAGIVYDARLREQEAKVHVTPRGGPPAPPPPWGMGDVGRPGTGVVRVGETGPRGGGAPRVMSVAVSNFDGPLLILGLLAWTAIALIFFAPLH
jgi:hypothetical protein